MIDHKPIRDALAKMNHLLDSIGSGKATVFFQDKADALQAFEAACNPQAIEALLRDLDEAKKNEARYLWLRNKSIISAGMRGSCIALPNYATNEDERFSLDQMIDAAIKGATP